MGQVLSYEKLKETGEALKESAIAVGVGTKNAVVAVGSATVTAAVATGVALDNHVWQPTRKEFRKVWVHLDSKHSEGDHNFALFRAALDGDNTLVSAALIEKKELRYHWEERYVELTDEPADVYDPKFPFRKLKVLEQYTPSRGIGVGGNDHIRLEKGAIVYGCLKKMDDGTVKCETFTDRNTNEVYWRGTLDPNTPLMLGEEFGLFPDKCVEPLPMYVPNWQRGVEAKDGRTALHVAAYNGNPEAVNILMKTGWDAWLKNEMDPATTPIECARLGGSPELALAMYKAQPPVYPDDLGSQDEKGGDHAQK